MGKGCSKGHLSGYGASKGSPEWVKVLTTLRDHNIYNLYLPLAAVAVEGAPVVAGVGAVGGSDVVTGVGDGGGSDDAPDGVMAPAASPPPLLTNITVRRTRMARPRTRRQMNLMRECFDMLFNFTSTFQISLWMSSIFCLWIPASFPPVLS